MEKMNKVMAPEQMAKVTEQFTKEHTKFTITDEMSMYKTNQCLFLKLLLPFPVGETLEAALGQEGDSDEEDAIVNQVLDEIGISLNEKVR